MYCDYLEEVANLTMRCDEVYIMRRPAGLKKLLRYKGK